MSLGAESRQRNFNLSVFRVVKQRYDDAALFGGVYFGHVFYQDALADPTALDERHTALGWWVDLQFIAPGLGQHLPTIMQADFYYLQGDYGTQSTGDRYGHKLTNMVDDFISIWSPSDCGFRIYDFAVPASPAITEAWAIVKNSRSMWGWPEERVRIEPDRGLQHEIVTYHFWFDQDLHPSQPNYF